MDIFNIDKLSLFLFFFVPGFVSTKVWNLLVPTEKRKITDYMLETISYSCINFAVLSWLINIISNKDFVSNHPVWLKLLTFIILFVFPIIWPMLIKFILSWDFFKGHIVHPTPRAWDRFFGLGHPCFVLIHLKSGKLIGGLYAGESFASSFPYKEDIYISEVWGVNEKGEFLDRIEGTKGMWISKDYFDYIEFFEITNSEEVTNNE